MNKVLFQVDSFESESKPKNTKCGRELLFSFLEIDILEFNNTR